MGKTISKSMTEAFAVVDDQKKERLKTTSLARMFMMCFITMLCAELCLIKFVNIKIAAYYGYIQQSPAKEESFSKAAAYVREAVDMEKLYHLIDNYKSPEQAQKV